LIAKVPTDIGGLVPSTVNIDMAIAIGEEITNNAVVGSVLFVGDGGGGLEALAQDSNDFHYDLTTNTLKSKDQTNAASSNFAIGTGDVSGSSSSNSGTLTIDSGDGSPNTSGSSTAGNSGVVTVTTGAGGASDNGSAAGNSANLLLKTGNGGANAFAGGTGGSAGNIIFQPGGGGTGPGGQGLGGSTFLRAASTASSTIFALQNSFGNITYWFVTPGGPMTGTLNNTALTASLTVNSQGAKTGAFTGVSTSNTATSSTASVTKTGVSVSSTGTWNGTSAVNRALYCNATGGTNNYAAIFENGNVGVGELSPTARLHLGAGTATVAPMKLTAGTNLTTPAAGAVEFDGTDLFITLSNGRRRFLTSEVANVRDFGAKGDDIADDTQPFRDAVASLVSTGGVVWVPPQFIYRIQGSVDIRSRFPIYIVSQMGTAAGLLNSNITAKTGHIKPRATITNGMFRWRKPDGAISDSDCGGGGIIGVTIADVEGTGGSRNYTVDAAVLVEQANNFVIHDCYVMHIKGSAIKLGFVSVARSSMTRIASCGNTNQPSVWVNGAGAVGPVIAQLFAEHLYVEDARNAPACKVEVTGALFIHRAHFESAGTGQIHLDANGYVEVSSSTFGACDAANAIVLRERESSLDRCRILNTPTAETILVEAAAVQLSNLYIEAGTGQTASCIRLTAAATQAQLDGIIMNGTGRLDVAAATNVRLSNILLAAPVAATGTHAIDLGSNNLVGATVNGNATATCHGIRTTTGTVTDAEVRNLNNANGFTTTAAGATLTACRASSLNGGTAFVLTTGNMISNLSPSERTATELTVAAGVITKSPAKVHHTVDTEDDAPTDDLNTINGVVEGDVFYLRPASDGRSIVFKHGTGNIQCDGNADITMDSSNDLATCFYNGTKVLVTLLNAGV
jgi:hypothetical protein